MLRSQFEENNQELLCIQTDKVYDWVINEASFDLNVTGLEFPLDPATGIQLECTDILPETVTCVVEPDEVEPIFVADRQDQLFVIDDQEVTLQLVTIRKNFNVTLFVDTIPTLGGTAIEVGTVPFTRCEQVILCAPEGTDILVNLTDVSCFVCNVNCEPGTTTEMDEINATVTVRLCQSIQSTHEVTIEVVAEFCEPREALPLPPCPPPVIPAQCPVLFPSVNCPTSGMEKPACRSGKTVNNSRRETREKEQSASHGFKGKADVEPTITEVAAEKADPQPETLTTPLEATSPVKETEVSFEPVQEKGINEEPAQEHLESAQEKVIDEQAALSPEQLGYAQEKVNEDLPIIKYEKDPGEE
ncbi:hypothetical protein [Gracilibacillus xinjiangensis]|uniref:DUF3794 domain-containing protein n=1 Tax=Gracilibacillus xinjiangensis TaxID=1193282 RepID=A0ABV8WWV1_9BACI